MKGEIRKWVILLLILLIALAAWFLIRTELYWHEADRIAARLLELKSEMPERGRGGDFGLLELSGLVAPPDGVITYFCPVVEKIDDFLKDEAKQLLVEAHVAANQQILSELSRRCKPGTVMAAVVDEKEFREYNTTIRKVVSLYCDQMALAISRKDVALAQKSCRESLYFLNAVSNTDFMETHGQYGRLISIWMVSLYDPMMAHFNLSMDFKAEIREELVKCKQLLQLNFREVLLSELLRFHRMIRYGEQNFVWRYDGGKKYFTLLEEPAYQDELVLRTGEYLLTDCCDFIYSNRAEFAALEKRISEYPNLAKRYCRLFIELYQFDLAISRELSERIRGLSAVVNGKRRMVR